MAQVLLGFVASTLIACSATQLPEPRRVHVLHEASPSSAPEVAPVTNAPVDVSVEPDVPTVTPSIDPDADLADRVMAWITRPRGPAWSKKWVKDAAFRFNPRVALKKGWPLEDWVRNEFVPAALAAAQGAHAPGQWPDAELLIVKAYWESRWKPDQVGRFVVRNGRLVHGRGGELGVMQIKPRICAQYTGHGEECADTRVNMRIAATILREHLVACEGRPRYALTYYGSGNGCAPPRAAERTVFIWADQLRRIRP